MTPIEGGASGLTIGARADEPAAAAASPLDGFRLRVYAFPRDRVIGDAFVRFEWNYLGALELFDTAGRSGLGFFYSLGAPLPGERELSDHFQRAFMAGLRGRDPESFIHQVPPGRGLGRSSAFALDEALELALWDLCAKRASLPLYRYLGGVNPVARAYASGLCFHMSESEFEAFYSRAGRLGFKAAKIKVGHSDVQWELARLSAAKAALGSDALLMVDANEAWTVKETLQRIDAYVAAGHSIYWVEDPIPRHDFQGLKLLRRSLRGAAVNAGEYLSGAIKRALVEAEAADVINIHNDFSECIRLAWLCESKGLKVGLGNTMMDVGAHMAAALPNAVFVEHAFLNDSAILRAPLPIANGMYRLTEAAGHGLELDPDVGPDLKPRGA